MFCENCGTQLNDDDLFCTKCGKRVVVEESVEKKEEKPVEQPAEEKEERPVEQPAEEKEEKPVEQPAETTADSVKESVEEKASEKTEAEPKVFLNGLVDKLLQKKVILIPAAAILVVVLLLVFHFSSVANFALKTVLSPEKYYSHVEKAEIKELSSMVANLYDNVFLSNANVFDTSVDAGVYLELGEDAKELISDYIDVDDTDWLDSIGLELKAASKDDVISGKAAALLGKNQIISGLSLIHI